MSLTFSKDRSPTDPDAVCAVCGCGWAPGTMMTTLGTDPLTTLVICSPGCLDEAYLERTGRRVQPTDMAEIRRVRREVQEQLMSATPPPRTPPTEGE